MLTEASLPIGLERSLNLVQFCIFAVEFLVGFGVNTIDTEKSPDVFSRVGLSFGYRF